MASPKKGSRSIKNKEPICLGLIGQPVGHSLSPDIFQLISQKTGIPVLYRKMEVSPADLKMVLKTLLKLPILSGWNVTLPHKQKVAMLMDQISPEVRVIGAVNVVKKIGKELHGFNTDLDGILETWKENRVIVRRKSAVLLGAGGAALAVGVALGQSGAARVWIANRTVEKARRMVRRLEQEFPKTQFQAIALAEVGGLTESIALYVQATPLGMQGFSETSLLPKNPSPGAVAFDLVYQPLQTAFLKAAELQGLKTVDGLDMLIWQALAAWEIWIGKIPHRRKLKQELKKALLTR